MNPLSRDTRQMGHPGYHNSHSPSFPSNPFTDQPKKWGGTTGRVTRRWSGSEIQTRTDRFVHYPLRHLPLLRYILPQVTISFSSLPPMSYYNTPQVVFSSSFLSPPLHHPDTHASLPPRYNPVNTVPRKRINKIWVNKKLTSCCV